MFRTGAAAADPPTPHAVDLPAELVALSVLELDLPAPGGGWAAHLADRGISIILDDIGRAAVARDDARRLFAEQREAEARGRERAAELERAAVEADQLRRAQMGDGVPAAVIPTGMSSAEAVHAAELDSRVSAAPVVGG